MKNSKLINILCGFLISCSSLAQNIAAGKYHSMFLDESSNVWVVGNNEYGQLGLNNVDNISKPTKIEGLPPIKAITAGKYHSLFLDENFCVWAVGDNRYGQLGLNVNYNHTSKPTKVENLAPIKSIAAGGYFSLLLDENGDVWISGSFPLIDSSAKYEKIESLSNIIAIATGTYHSIFLDNKGEVWTAGDNQYDQLGVRNHETIKVPVKIEILSSIKEIAAGGYHSLALNEECCVFTFGQNFHGQLGRNIDQAEIPVPRIIPDIKTIKAMAAGYCHSIILDMENYIYFFGSQDYKNNHHSLNKIENKTPIVSIAAGYYHDIYVDKKGNVWVFGSNSHGQLGLGDNEPRNMPTKIEGIPVIKRLAPKIPTKSARNLINI